MDRTSIQIEDAIVGLLGGIGGVKHTRALSLSLAKTIERERIDGTAIFVRTTTKPFIRPSVGPDPTWTKEYNLEASVIVPVRGSLTEAIRGSEGAQVIGEIMEGRLINRKILRGDGGQVMAPLVITEIEPPDVDYEGFVVCTISIRTSTTYIRRSNVTHSSGPNFPSDPSAGDMHYLTGDGLTYTYMGEDQWLSNDEERVVFVQTGAAVSGNAIPPDAINGFIGFGGRSMVLMRVELNMDPAGGNDGFTLDFVKDDAQTALESVVVPPGDTFQSVDCNIPVGTIIQGEAGLVLKADTFLGAAPADFTITVAARRLGVNP